ncbi:Gfo/Idh/MocA family protein [Zhihengliuella halotolerans]|uniref:Gfo/Idh/MocA family protein n=1 Tax=Zhihengliuella halotolerans TaxID=370736 RepID=UPI000C800AA6|nr:Gfo/Idh/MocA family oxidoreductase [Zhihengliuella halotolerans]
MTSLRWGILATGGISGMFARDARTAGLTLAAVGSRSAGAAEEFAAEHSIPRAHASYAELAADDGVDIIYVGTPHPWHFENALLALEHGKHVLVEKPFTLNQREAIILRETARARGLLLLEAMWTRYLPHMIRIHQIIDAGGLGEIRALTTDHTQSLPTDPEHRLNALSLGGGALLDVGVYPVSFAWDILGRPETIKASARLGDTGADTEIATVFTHASGAVSTTLSSIRSAGPNRASIIGTQGRIEIDPIWFAPTSFTHYGPDGAVVEQYVSEVDGRGMQFQALAAERFVASGDLAGDELTIDETVEIMGTLDEIRAQVGLTYPQESTAGAR